MAVVLFDHSRVSMAEIFRDNQHRHAVHDGMAGPCVPQTVEIDRWSYLSIRVGGLHRLGLMRSQPRLVVSLQE